MERPWFKSWPEGLPKSLDYPVVPLFDFLRNTAGRLPDKSAIIFYGREVTFGELDELSDRFANALAEMGVGKGDRVGMIDIGEALKIDRAIAGFKKEISRIREDKQRRHRLMVEAMVDSALGCIRVLEDKGFEDIVVSLKASDVPVTILANKIIAEKINYPLHLGVTATGPPPEGIIKSAIGLGSLLCEGIGDTIRVSLTADPIEEIKVAYQILKYLGFVDMGPTIISCPTCGRKRGDVYSIVKQISKEVGKITSPLKIAVMGCEVNGPGEAIEADIGVACTTGGAVIFKKGRLLNKIRKEQIVPTLLKELRSMDHNLKGT